jgi:hypothetical protein
MPKKEIKKSVNDYNYYLGSAKQASDYEMITKFLINYIIKTFKYGNNIGQALRELEYPDPDSWKPTMQQSVHLGNDPDDEFGFESHSGDPVNRKTRETKLREHSRTSNLRSNSNQSLTTFVSENELWTIISQKLMHFCGNVAPRA